MVPPTCPSHCHEGHGAACHPGQRHSWREPISAIGHGICVLLGISLEDTPKELEHMVQKILNLHVFEDESEQAESFYNRFLEQLRKSYRPELIKDGKSGACTQVHVHNDGPVTTELESPAPGAATSDPKQLSKLEKQQQMKEKTRDKGPSESNKETNSPEKKTTVPAAGQRVMCPLSRSHSP
ncbi:D-tyrosyl-tRNA(Tyr) deacylase 1 [Sciurus carolinensis]|uniref:D-aminoacyl-tRNA deacylase n=1 Tax=Sciurus carolinensis TaxID=30640 RepID=A0AA41T343_SCICA|nr:D-tyrosyl-tRNA(Tyr) deacylase 1 [Sciurus carolinensis]